MHASPQTKESANFALFLATLPAAAALAAHVSLGGLSRFLADDFCVAYYAQRFGLLRSVWYWYRTWNGRFSNSLMDWLLVVITARGIPYVTSAVIALWLATGTFAISLALPKVFPLMHRIAVALGFAILSTFVTLLLAPDVPESLYWWSGMRAYTLPLVISNLSVGMYLWLKNHPKAGGAAVWALVGFGLTLLIGGTSETLAPVQFAFVGAIVVSILLTMKSSIGDSSRCYLIGSCLGASAALAIVVAAPGNASRQAFYPPSPGLLGMIYTALPAFVSFVTSILGAPDKLAGMLGGFLTAMWLATRIVPATRGRRWMPVAVLIVGMALAFACFLPAAWGLSDVPPDRNLIIPCYVLVVSLMLAGFAAGASLPPILAEARLAIVQFALLAVSILLISYSGWIETRRLLSARETYAAYAAKWDLVDRQIIQARDLGSQVVHIPAMDGWTALNIPNDNPRFWLNICYSQYYGIQVLSP